MPKADEMTPKAVPISPFARLYRALCSPQFAVILLLLTGLVAVPGTVDSHLKELSAPVVSLLLGLLGFTTALCTIRSVQRLPAAVIVVHAGVILTLAGGVVRGFGSVATVNIYEGDTVSQAYRWDLKRDAPLGFDLLVKKIGFEYYPTPVKVGVLKGEEKYALITTATGETFDIGGFQAKVEGLDPVGKALRISVSEGGRTIGVADTSTAQQLPGGFPFAFRLVSYKTPKLKRMWVDLALSRDGRVAAEGSSQVNSPLHWGDYDLFHTQTASDAAGRAYAGIQVVRDPGRPLVFVGFVVVSLGVLMALARRLRSR